jgi:predicted metalloendopeptidase
MDEATRAAARTKKGTLTFRIGYPDAWRDYSDLAVARTSHFDNSIAAMRFESARQLAKVGKPLDRQDWSWNPQVVNAGYHPLRNDHTYPAGILQPPFFHKDFPAAMNYGAIGYVIGHELTHGFDDQGRKFDSEGRLSDWWTPAAVTGFEERAACIREQYAGYEIEPGVKVNGELTLGENIADNGGLKQAWAAFQRYQGEHPDAAKGVGSLTADQLFFVSAAQVWCTESSPEFLRMLVATDPHSPSTFRVSGPLVNHPAFAQAFSCAEGKPMNPPQKCTVW